MKKQMKKSQGITLIALAVTIIVLLILAGVSISMLTGENGIITQAQNAKLETRAGNVREEVDLWKSENVLRDINNQEQISKETMLSNLKDKGILYEEEINRQEEIITIGKNVIPYGTEIKFNITKTPETKLSLVVLLRVTDIEGVEKDIKIESMEQYIELLLDKINSMTDSDREALYANVHRHMFQEEGEDISIENFNDLLQVMYEYNVINEPTEEAFYEYVENNGGIESFHEEIAYMIINYDYNLIGEYDHDTGILRSYIIINPDGEEKDYYIATQNGDYTFIVEDVITGKQSSKTINVNNIGETVDYYVDNIMVRYDFDDSIGLLDKVTNTPTTFDKMFIIYNNKIVEITDLIQHTNNMSYVDGNDVADRFEGIRYTEQTFLIEKDGILYVGNAFVGYGL